MLKSISDSELRSAAERRGYLLKKSQKNSFNNYGGYMIVDINNCVVAGEKFSLMPEDVKEFLSQE